MNYNFLNVRIEDRVGWIEYNRPPINSFNWEKLREVPAALDNLLNDPQVRVIVFASANEKYFSTGADLKVFDGIGAEGMEEWTSICHGFVNKMRKADKPLLAAIHGVLQAAVWKWCCIVTFVLHPPMRVWVSRR